MSIGQRPGIKPVGQSSSQAVGHRILPAACSWAETQGVNDSWFGFLSPWKPRFSGIQLPALPRGGRC